MLIYSESLRLFFAIINSLFSFYWDVSKDWDLTLFKHERSRPEHPWGLRRRLVFRSNSLYYAAIVLDFLLRFTWSFGFISTSQRLRESESGVFLVVLLELFRRWLWVFFRVEAEERTSITRLVILAMHLIFICDQSRALIGR